MQSFQGIEALRALNRDCLGGLHPLALATLVQTRGSSLRRPGARLLVRPDGSRTGNLSGGCPEADIVAHALEAMCEARPRIVRYDRRHGWDAMVEAGCDGELEVLVEPVMAWNRPGWSTLLEQCVAERQYGFLATLYHGDAADPSPQRLLLAGCHAHCGIRDVRLRRRVEAMAAGACAGPAWQTLEHDGSPLAVLCEPIRPGPALVVIGQGPIAIALLRLARQLGWACSLVEPRRRERLPCDLADVPVLPVQAAGITRVAALDPATAVVVMTHQLEMDAAYLGALGTTPLAYLGVLGSRRRKALLAQRPGLASLQVRGPVGLDLGAETPEEIALSISAEILAASNAKSGRPLFELVAAIH